MKRVNYFFISMFLLVSLLACEKDDAVPPADDLVENSEKIDEETSDAENPDNEDEKAKDTEEEAEEKENTKDEEATTDVEKEENTNPDSEVANTEEPVNMPSEDEQPNEETENDTETNMDASADAKIAGVWKITGYNAANGKSTRTLGALVINGAFTETGSDYNYTVNFKTNKSISVAGNFVTTVNTVRDNGTVINQIITESDNIFGVTWEVNNNILKTVNKNFITTTYKIVRLTENRMILSFDLAQTSKGSEVVSGERFLIFERQ